MKKSLLLIIIIGVLLNSDNGFAQKNEIAISLSIPNYYFLKPNFSSVTDKIENTFINEGINLKTTKHYPFIFSEGIEYSFQFSEKNKIGLIYQYSTNGSQLNYSDFTGEINILNTIVSHSIGVSFSTRLFNIDGFYLPKFVMVYGVNFISVKQSYKENYYANPESNFNFNETASDKMVFSEIGLRWNYNFYNLNISYNISLSASTDGSILFRNNSENSKNAVVKYNHKMNFHMNNISNKIGIGYLF